MSTNVLVAVDGSDIAERAFRWYMEKFHKPTHQVTIVHIPEYWGDVQRMMSPARIQELVEETNANTVKLQQKMSSVCQEKGIEAKFEAVKGAEAWHEICRYAEKVHAECIVIGSRGMGVIKRTILGSVSDGVLHHCHIPILIYQEPHHGEQQRQ